MDYSIAYHPNYVLPVPQEHRFPMIKYELLPQQVVHRGIVSESQFFQPNTCPVSVIKEVHDPHYVDNFVQLKLDPSAVRKIGFKHDQLLVERELTLVQGTIQGAINALTDGLAFNIAGGTHHACYAHGEGFCMLHDQAIAAHYLWKNHSSVNKVLIIDLDVHQGNGTASLLGQHPDIFTLSIHCEKNYPFKKEKSHWDIGLEDGIGDDIYLSILQDALNKLKSIFKPDFIFYQAGVDILYTDKMGKLSCTLDGCATRDKLVFEFAQSLGVPIQCSMGGGYSPNIADILEAHTNTFIQANEVFGLK